MLIKLFIYGEVGMGVNIVDLNVHVCRSGFIMKYTVEYFKSPIICLLPF